MPPRHRKLAAFYFFYFASLGVYLPYWAPYLRELGFDAVAIGELLAVVFATKLFAPYIWGWIADHTAGRLRMLRWASGLSVLFYGLLLVRQDYAWLVIWLFFSGFFLNALLPQLESITLDSLGHMTRHYSRIRLWGSLGFIACAAGFSPVIAHYGLYIVPYLVLGVLAAMWVVSLYSADRRRRAPQTSPPPIWPSLRRPEILSLIALCFLMQLTHAPYYGFFSIYMRDTGYGETLIGQMWAFGVIAEVGIFLLVPRFLPRWGAPALLSFSMAVTALRWMLIAKFPQQLPVILFAQALHAITFGVYHAAAIDLIDRWFPGVLQGRGQALYSAVSFGFGGALGSLLAGRLWDGWGAGVFVFAAATAAMGVLLTLPLYRAAHKPVRPPD